ncbi:exonuclease domain-containing protein [Bifidobacterium sp. SO1]|uniref:exonuclease domain-containing protein n=1 Tax=Bifidobacterium sp. SO1 TaxID=2809029 RepID=UPI001BDC97E1|nr:exonuclease domain-containing protein [Bifidobacterium sp. SO1]MBT1161286.1 3'-5' exoribonuclease [Bifidobacterium sp. SO1]
MPLNFTAVDFETGNGEICAIGAVKYRDGQKIGEFHHLVNTNNGDYTNIFEVRKNGNITADMVKNEPEWPEIYPSLIEFIEDDILVAHNAAAADKKYVERACRRYRIYPPIGEWFCTQIFYDNAMPEHKEMKYKYQQASDLKSASRVVLGEKLEHHHDALCDALACARVAVALANNLYADDLQQADSLARERSGAWRSSMIGPIDAFHCIFPESELNEMFRNRY